MQNTDIKLVVKFLLLILVGFFFRIPAHAIIVVSNLPTNGVHSFKPAAETSEYWDINGDGVDDIEILGHPWFNGIGTINDAQFVVPASIDERGMSRLDTGFSVSEILPTGYKFHTEEQAITGVNNMLPVQNGDDPVLNPRMVDCGWTLGTSGYFGFKFVANGDTHYGWGEFTIDNDSFSIDKAWYEDTPNTAILVGTVPEPSTYTLIMGSIVFTALMLRHRLKS
jgi:hypothetical protein